MTRTDPTPGVLVKQQIRLLALVWVAIASAAVLCVLVASSFALRSQAQIAQQALPTATAISEVSLIEPLAEGEFGYGIQIRAEVGDIESTINLVASPS